MSHFTVLVIGEDVEGQLQPYHEYECTGVKDKYVVWVDETDEVLKDWPEHKDDYETIEEFADNWFGYKKNEEGRYGHFTNPNAKWDWWVVGGRWTGFFKVKKGCENAAETGQPGLMTKPAKEGYADRLRLGAIDWDQMRETAILNAMQEYDEFEEAVGDLTPPESWKTIMQRHENIEDARNEFHNHPWNQALKRARFWSLRDPVEYYECHNGGRETFIQKKLDAVGVPYAFVKDSEWVGKGDMGWWGISSGDLDENDWNRKYHEMLDSLDPNTVVTLVDCHI